MAPCLDELRCLDINRLVKIGAIPKCGCHSGSLKWTDKETGEELSSIGYRVDTASHRKTMRLEYKIIDTDQDVDVTIELSTSQQPFGGERFWFICPVSGKRVTKLYAVSGGYEGYVSRHCYKIHYASQLGSAVDRAIHKRWKLLDKTDGAYYPVRPKGMHYKTFEKLEEEYYAHVNLCDAMFLERMERYF